MKIAYLDLIGGLSGDMFLGALLDIGLSLDDLRGDLSRLGVGGIRVETRKERRGAIQGTRCLVAAAEGASRQSRTLPGILSMIEGSPLPERAKGIATEAFGRLGEAEAAVHGTSLEEVHFHEVGALDSIADIMGVALGVTRLCIDRFFVSEIRLGRGWVRCEHGELPVPSPATLAILKGAPLILSAEPGERVTPTGAALLATLVGGYGAPPPIRISAIGYGVGSRSDGQRPNVFRLLVGEAEGTLLADRVDLIEMNIDDMSPQLYDYLLERLYDLGALEAYLTPVIMKKSRPACLLTVLSPPARTGPLARFVLEETTTFGLRVSSCSRRKLARETVRVDTPFGTARVKVGIGPEGGKKMTPEYDDCRRLAVESGLPFLRVHAEVLRAAERKGKSEEGDAS